MTVRTVMVEPLDTLRVTLDAPKGNVLDAAMVAGLSQAFEQAAGNPRLRAVVLDAAGNDFCFGASVEEHLPNQVRAMLSGFHRLLLKMVELPVPVLVAVQGRCLGGGLELALAGSRIFASANALLGQPEVKLGVFAPAASAMLPGRVGAAVAEDLLLTGRSLKGADAHAVGLIDELCVDTHPAERALAYVERELKGLSRTGLRFACRAARQQRVAALKPTLEGLEKLYLDELMTTADAVEGLSAFLEKRPAKWAEVNA